MCGGVRMNTLHELAQECGWCYAQVEKMLRCGKCKKRAYCSKPCQLNDWKLGLHKQWCGNSGEFGHDVVARSTIDGQFGMFATRHFARGAKLLVERWAATKKGTSLSDSDISEGMRQAAVKLMPRETSDVASKFKLNAFETPDGSEGLYIHFAYANHSCMPNASHHSITSPIGLKILVASRAIEPDEEVCIQYVSVEGEAKLAQRGQPIGSVFREWWGFECECVACKTPALRAELTRMCELDSAIVACTASDVREPEGPRRFDEALCQGAELISLYDELGVSPAHYVRTYHLLFQLGVTRRTTLAQARKYIQLAWENQLLLVGRETVCEEASRLAELVRAPETHQAYLAGEA